MSHGRCGVLICWASCRVDGTRCLCTGCCRQMCKHQKVQSAMLKPTVSFAIIFLCLPWAKGNFKKSTKFHVLPLYTDRALKTSSPISCAGICQASTDCEFYYFTKGDLMCHMGTRTNFKNIHWGQPLAEQDVQDHAMKFHITRSVPNGGNLFLS